MNVRSGIALIILVCVSLLSHPAHAQLSQQGPKLVGTGDFFHNPGQGFSVSISSDGNTAIVGGPEDRTSDGTNRGAAWVWTRSGEVWTQQGPKLVGSFAIESTYQGISVGLSADGNTAIVGGYGDLYGIGAAWIWTRNGGVWTQQGPKLVGAGASGNALQGTSVALSADGNTAIVGGPRDNGGVGAVWIWTRNGDVWTQRDRSWSDRAVSRARSRAPPYLFLLTAMWPSSGGPATTTGLGAHGSGPGREGSGRSREKSWSAPASRTPS